MDDHVAQVKPKPKSGAKSVRRRRTGKGHLGSERSVAREQKVRSVMAKMAAGEWVTRVSSDQLCAEWGITKANMDSVSSEASRRLVAAYEADPEMRMRAMVTIQGIAADCERIQQAIAASGRPEFRTMLEALRIKFDIAKFMAIPSRPAGAGAGLSFNMSMVQATATTQTATLNEEQLKARLISQGWLPGPVGHLPMLNAENPSEIERNEHG